jgi:peptide/nickel transport system permease protein
MENNASVDKKVTGEESQFNEFIQNVLYKSGWSGIVGMILVLALIMIAIFAPLIAPYSPYEMQQGNELQNPSVKHLAGTDEFGRDILSRTIYGARYSLGIALGGVASAMIIGAVLGLLAGVSRGKTDAIIMRITDVLLSFPPILLGIIIITVANPGAIKVGIAIFFANVPRFTRFMRANVLREINLEYVEAERALGGNRARLMFKHILPNCMSSLLVQANIAMVNAILLEAGLSFIGLGAQAPEPSWGLMLRDARAYLQNAPYYALAPGLSLSALMIGLNFFTDALRSILDPKSLG